MPSYEMRVRKCNNTCAMFCPGHLWETWLEAGHEVILYLACTNAPDSQEESVLHKPFVGIAEAQESSANY